MPPLAADASPAGACRLRGALKPNTVLPAAATTKQRVRIGGAVAITVRHKLTAGPTGTPDLNIVGLGADATMDEANAATTTATAAATAVMSNTEVSTDFVCKGEEYIEIQCVLAGGEAGTIDYIDVLTKRG